MCGIEDTNLSTTLLSVESLRVCRSQMNYINFQSVYLKRKSMSYTVNSLTNHGKKLNITEETEEILAFGALDHKSIRYYLQNKKPPCIWSDPPQIDSAGMSLIPYADVRTEEFLNETNQTFRESDIINFESNFFQDVPEEDELPINFEIPGPIPDMVDLYNFDVPKEEKSSTMERQSSPKLMVLTSKIDEEVISSPVDFEIPGPIPDLVDLYKAPLETQGLDILRSKRRRVH
ncbi:hypothetical protein FF1_014302 [Malus domestica]